MLGVSPSATEAEIRAAYRRLVQLHHPDHNAGSADAARRFELVQEAYAEVRRRRAYTHERTDRRAGPPTGSSQRPAGDGHRADPDLEARLAAMEQELRDARDARERALREARRAAQSATPGRPSDEELGYFSTDDSLTKIIDDAAAELSGRLKDAAHSPTAHRVSDLLDDLTSKLTGEHHRRD